MLKSKSWRKQTCFKIQFYIGIQLRWNVFEQLWFSASPTVCPEKDSQTVHPWGLNITEKEQNKKKNDWAWSILEVGVASPTHTFPFSSHPGIWGPIFGSGCLSVSQRVCWDQTDVTDEDSNSNRAHNLFHDNRKLIVLAINCNHSASKNKIKSKLYHL